MARQPAKRGRGPRIRNIMAQRTPSRVSYAPPLPKRLSGSGAHLSAKLATNLAGAEPGEIDAEIEEALGVVGRFLSADAVSLCVLGKDRALRASREWRRVGWMEPSFALDLDRAPWWREHQDTGEDVIVSDVRALTDDAGYERELLDGRGVRALLAVDFGDRDTQRGYIVAEMFREPRDWLPDDVNLLSALAAIVTSALARARHQERLLESARQAEKASSVRSRFIAMLAHEIRTPLTAITGYAQMLESQLGGSDRPEAASCIRDILECTAHVTSLITDTLDLARIDSGHMPLELEQVDVKTALDSALAAIRPRARSQNVDIDWEPPEAPLHARADPRRLRQLVINLVANAVSHSRERDRVILGAWQDSEHYAIIVEDFGPGIAPRDRERIFECFDRAGETSGDGAGIGLALVKRLAKLHGGEVFLDSELGRGTRVEARLPKRPRRAVAPGPYVPTTGTNP